MPTPPEHRWLERISLEGFLSFGPGVVEVELGPLNVLIGPNGAGKSNLVEALAVLRAVPRDLPRPIRHGGGVRDFLWKGEAPAAEAKIEFVRAPGLVSAPGHQTPAVRYWLRFGAQGSAFVVSGERLEAAVATAGKDKPYFYFGYEEGRATLNVKEGRRELRREDIDPTQSILSQRRDPESYPEISALADELAKIRIYRNWSFGPDAPIRASCRADVRTDSLSEDFDNLPARLAVLCNDFAFKRRLRELLAIIAPSFDDVNIVPEGGQLQLYVVDGGRSMPARRLSDGTLRFLALLAILLDPSPPPLVVIEEPELGLHPDTLPVIRDLLLDARARTQLVVTTHSTMLVDGFTEHPEAIVICDRVDGGTQLRRLDAERVAVWRQHGSLGQLWLDGLFGGMRW
ncbi:AAA family ATPase [Nannocystis sp.]|uniref:AAA family ATPase n=1 Tax=Nannocystis sp. TaxID=1962667 RepID=UPI0025D08643|nr:AAA family ATPase [Nannocystis sp.]MBK7827530.1 AAA family ATPase [Nannocystis sp.]